jgi:hypothetical protein
VDPILESPVDVGDAGVVLDEAPSGLPLIALPSALTGLHYFDGQAMRDTRLTAEQTYRRALAAMAARAGGWGVAWGFDVGRADDDEILIAPGVGVTGVGRVLQLNAQRRLSMASLIGASRTTMMAMAETAFTSLEFLRCIRKQTRKAPSARGRVEAWVLTLSWAQQSGIFKSGTVTREGVRVRAVPLAIRTPPPRSKTVTLDARRHARSLLASAIFADEWADGGSLVSRAGLMQGAWCRGAQWDPRADVPIALVAMTDGKILFIDRWAVCRELHDMPPARYWAGLMRMRSWSAYIAQVLQFQCQLASADVSAATPVSTGCEDVHATLNAAGTYFSRVYQLWQAPFDKTIHQVAPEARVESDLLYQAGGVTRLEILMRDTVAAVAKTKPLGDRLLIRRGIVELPPAGYLPVAIGKSPTVNDQVRALMGEGVDLRFCIVHPDVVAHELEEGQHMERISLLTGIDDPARKQEVDIFVPDGLPSAAPPRADLYEAAVRIKLKGLGDFRGTARREPLPSGGAELSVAVSGIVANFAELLLALRERDTAGGPIATDATGASIPSADTLWISTRTDRSIRDLRATERADLHGRAVLASVGAPVTGPEITFDGQLIVRTARHASRGAHLAEATIEGRLAVMNRRTAEGADVSILIARRLSLLAEIRWIGDETKGRMTARLFARPKAGLRARTVRTMAMIQKSWGDAAPRTSILVRTPMSLVDLIGGDDTLVAAGSPTPEQFVALDLVENPDVARAENPLHVLAVRAVAGVQALLDSEPTFSRDALRSLFPPPPKPQLLVEATHNWVLFRRRRDKRSYIWKEPRTVGVRYFRLLQLTVPNADAAQDVLEVFRTTGTPDRAARLALAASRASTPVLVAFPANDAAPLGDPDELRRAWAQLDPGSTIVAGVIASTRGEGPELLVRRLRALTPRLAPKSLLAPDASLLSLATLPADLVTLDADGVILLVTVAST